MALSDYERYQLEWMIAHGYSLGDLVNEMGIDQNGEDGNIAVNDAFEHLASKGENKSIFDGPTDEYPRPLQRARREAGFRTASDFADAVGIPEYPKFERELAIASPFDQIKIAREFKSCGVDPSILACPTVESVKRWEAAIDAEIGQLVKNGPGFPPCWGGVYRINDSGHYITEDQFYSVLETEAERKLYYALTAANCGLTSYEDVAEHVTDGQYIDKIVDYALDYYDFPMFYTEIYPDDFTEAELVDMVFDRPDLFTAEQRDEFPELQVAFDRYQKEHVAPDIRAKAAKATVATESAADVNVKETQGVTRTH